MYRQCRYVDNAGMDLVGLRLGVLCISFVDVMVSGEHKMYACVCLRR